MPKVGEPLWWVERLENELTTRRGPMRDMNDYYNGTHPLPFLTKAHEPKMRSEFAQLLEDSRANFMRLVVDAVEERLGVDGFRLSAETEPVADQESWRIWQANQMDAESQTAFLESLVKGVSYLSVWAGDEYPTIAVEDPLQTIVAYEPGSNFRRRAAALKVWLDDWTGEQRANLYLPGGIYKFAAPDRPDPQNLPQRIARAFEGPGSGWKELEDSFIENPLGVVPIVPLRNRPRLLCEGESELADVYRIQNQINAFIFLLALAGYFGAHRQRWATKIPLHENENGEVAEPFDAAIDKLWTSEDPETKFGEFEQTDLGHYIKAIEQKVLHIAVTTRTPRHYLIEQGQSPSGDAIKSAESGLVKKTQRKQKPFGEGLEEAIRLARRFSGEPDTPPDSEIVWADPATPTEAETTDAVIKQFSGALIPWEAALEKLGYTQTQIARFSVMRQSDALLRALENPEPETTPELEPAS